MNLVKDNMQHVLKELLDKTFNIKKFMENIAPLDMANHIKSKITRDSDFPIWYMKTDVNYIDKRQKRFSSLEHSNYKIFYNADDYYIQEKLNFVWILKTFDI